MVFRNNHNMKSKFFFDVNWMRVLRCLVFFIVAAVIIMIARLTLLHFDDKVYGNREVVKEKVLIDVSVSDTLTRGMDDKLNHILQDLLQIKQDSVFVEVRKVHNAQQ